MMKHLSLILCLMSINALGESKRNEEEFRLAVPGYDYQFPRDHGSHPDFKIEWWYITGHLQEDGGSRRFGYQATFFRAAIQSPAQRESSPNKAFANDHAYLAHMAMIDIESGKFLFEERLNRSGWDASASEADLDVRNGNWRLCREPSETQEETMKLVGSIRGDVLFDLVLEPGKARVIFGENGISVKSQATGAASHYITFTRLVTSGTVNWQGKAFSVTGQSWMDHEFSSSQLGPNQVGWDWASIQLDDGREIMMYQLRDQSGAADPSSQLTWIDEDGKLHAVEREDWNLEAKRKWRSPDTGALYPIDFLLTTRDPKTGGERMLALRPVHDHQEIVGRIDQISYWEGACEVINENGEAIGQAYVELTGYDGRLGDRLR